MPFRRRCRVTITNMDEVATTLYYQIDCTLTDVPNDAAYFHASFRRSIPLPYKSDHTIIDGIAGKGHYVGTYMAWGSNNTGWWGEGEIKFFIGARLAPRQGAPLPAAAGRSRLGRLLVPDCAESAVEAPARPGPTRGDLISSRERHESFRARKRRDTSPVAEMPYVRHWTINCAASSFRSPFGVGNAEQASRRTLHLARGG